MKTIYRLYVLLLVVCTTMLVPSYLICIKNGLGLPVTLDKVLLFTIIQFVGILAIVLSVDNYNNVKGGKS